jgi:hypothetical protein
MVMVVQDFTVAMIVVIFRIEIPGRERVIEVFPGVRS